MRDVYVDRIDMLPTIITNYGIAPTLAACGDGPLWGESGRGIGIAYDYLHYGGQGSEVMNAIALQHPSAVNLRRIIDLRQGACSCAPVPQAWKDPRPQPGATAHLHGRLAEVREVSLWRHRRQCCHMARQGP